MNLITYSGNFENTLGYTLIFIHPLIHPPLSPSLIHPHLRSGDFKKRQNKEKSKWEK